MLRRCDLFSPVAAARRPLLFQPRQCTSKELLPGSEDVLTFAADHLSYQLPAVAGLTDLRTVSGKARLAFSIRCQRSATLYCVRQGVLRRGFAINSGPIESCCAKMAPQVMTSELAKYMTDVFRLFGPIPCDECSRGMASSGTAFCLVWSRTMPYA